MTSPRRALRVPTLVALLVLLTLAPWPAAAADAEQEARLQVTITDLSPTVLEDGDTVTLSGTVTNAGEQAWTDTQAYLVAPRVPFTTRQQVTDAVESGASYTGERRIELTTIDELGTLAPGGTQTFTVRVPYDVLGVSGGEGVYPVGVQILGTAEDGTRSSTAIGRATTFLPAMTGGARTPTAVVVPFVSPERRGDDGYSDPEGLADLVASGGQLRNLLDLARGVPRDGLTVLVDPALLVVLDDLAEDRRMPDGFEPSAEQREDAAAMRDDLVGLARQVTCWVLGFGRPDVLAIEESGTAALSEAVARATTATVNRFGLSGRRVTWPTRNGVTEDLVASVRGRGEAPVVVGQSAVPDWEPRLGAIVTRPTDAGPVPLLVSASLDTGVPGEVTVATLRQRVLAESALSSLQRDAEPDAQPETVAVLDPQWDPGTGIDDEDVDGAFDTDFVEATDLDALLGTEREQYTGSLPGTAEAAPVRPDQVREVDDALDSTASFVALLADSARVLESRSERAAELTSIAWRDHPEDGLAAARRFAERSAAELGSITVEGPPAVTLSSSEGSFPLTVTNGSDEAVRVGLRLTSTNPRLRVPDVEAVEVAAGERRTLTVNASVGDQSSSTFTATMTAADGRSFGEPAVFNVRSSRVGAAVWVAMGVAGLFVVLALGRRFFTRRGREAADV